MCGRYHIDEEMTEEIRRMVKILESRLNVGSRDIYPSMEAPVILKNEGEGLKAASMAWGFPGREKKQLLINARAETALERPSFSRAVSHRRCVIPARWFYEWNPEKEKAEFSRNGRLPSVYGRILRPVSGSSEIYHSYDPGKPVGPSGPPPHASDPGERGAGGMGMGRPFSGKIPEKRLPDFWSADRNTVRRDCFFYKRTSKREKLRIWKLLLFL